uniref:Uncharacterized protein n=1 Tax=Cacopsylla melanoneura TaxID=428564 RepID=A0A8D8Z9S7_9HEMI
MYSTAVFRYNFFWRSRKATVLHDLESRSILEFSTLEYLDGFYFYKTIKIVLPTFHIDVLPLHVRIMKSNVHQMFSTARIHRCNKAGQSVGLLLAKNVCQIAPFLNADLLGGCKVHLFLVKPKHAHFGYTGDVSIRCKSVRIMMRVY